MKRVIVWLMVCAAIGTVVGTARAQDDVADVVVKGVRRGGARA